MHDIEMHEVSEEFARCWRPAGLHIQKQVQGKISWLRAHLNPPFLEHFSFRLGNQLFFIRIEDEDGKVKAPGSRQGLQTIADGCKGHPCIMPMALKGGDWTPVVGGWGLLDAQTGRQINPIDHVSDQRIEMTDWELHDFAVQVVRDHLTSSGRKLMSWQGNPAVDPSIWFVGDAGPEWVVVRAARYPHAPPGQPANWDRIAESSARLSRIGHFAPIVVANADDAFHSSVPALPLWRGHALTIRFQGLMPK